MLGALGVIIAEATTGVAWQDAGKVELGKQSLSCFSERRVEAFNLLTQGTQLQSVVSADGAQYLGFSLPFSVSQLLWIEAILVGELCAICHQNKSSVLMQPLTNLPEVVECRWSRDLPQHRAQP